MERGRPAAAAGGCPAGYLRVLLPHPAAGHPWPALDIPLRPRRARTVVASGGNQRRGPAGRRIAAAAAVDLLPEPRTHGRVSCTRRRHNRRCFFVPEPANARARRVHRGVCGQPAVVAGRGLRPGEHAPRCARRAARRQTKPTSPPPGHSGLRRSHVVKNEDNAVYARWAAARGDTSAVRHLPEPGDEPPDSTQHHRRAPFGQQPVAVEDAERVLLAVGAFGHRFGLADELAVE